MPLERVIINTQRVALNFSKKVDTNEHSDESECEDCDTVVESHNTDKRNLMQVNIIDKKIVSSYHPLENYKLLKCTFGKSNRLCQSSRFKTYKWLRNITKNMQ